MKKYIKAQRNQDAAQGNGNKDAAHEKKAAHFNKMNGTVHQTDEVFKKWAEGSAEAKELGLVSEAEAAEMATDFATAKAIFDKAIAKINAAKEAAGIK